MPTAKNNNVASKTEKESNKDVLKIPLDKLAIIDDKASYIINGDKLIILIDLPADLKDICTDDNISSTGKTYRVYSNSTNRKFIKTANHGYNNIQIQINGYLSTKDAEKSGYI